MRWLVDGDEASNNGNWQGISSVGVDPAPYFRRMYNPMTQERRHDPDGASVRRWVPELRDVPLAKLAEPWTMTDEEQRAAGCAIGEDYPAPIVDHKAEREHALARYRAASTRVRSS
jgi:deoxyribodipyrimidine photo-lyase